MAVTWLVADLKTGVVLDELPLDTDNALERTVGAAMSTSATLPIADDACPPNWSQLLAGGRTMLVALDDGEPLAGYLLSGATPGGVTVPISMTSLEGILEADFCPTVDFTNTDESTILASLCAGVIAEFGLTLDATACGKLSDQSYDLTEDRTIASAATDLMAGGGPEWIINVSWANDDHTAFRKTLQIAAQVGARLPSVVFANEHVADRKRPRDWSPGKYANDVQATGDGAGDSRPFSAAQVDTAAIAAGAPRWKSRVSAPTVDTDAGLDAYAANSLTRMRYGAQMLELELAAAVESCPRVGRDFNPGDTVTLQLDPLVLTPDGRVVADTGFGEGAFGDVTFGAPTLPGDRTEMPVVDAAAFYGPVRCAGWRANLSGRTITNITPVFWQPEDRP